MPTACEEPAVVTVELPLVEATFSRLWLPLSSSKMYAVVTRVAPSVLFLLPLPASPNAAYHSVFSISLCARLDILPWRTTEETSPVEDRTFNRAPALFAFVLPPHRAVPVILDCIVGPAW